MNDDAGNDLGDLGGLDDVPATSDEDVVDAELVDEDAPDARWTWQSEDVVDAEVVPGDGEADARDEDEDAFPELPRLDDDDEVNPGDPTRDVGDNHGQPKYPNAGGGSSRSGPGAMFGRKKKPKAAGAKFGGTGGPGGSGGGFSIFGGINVRVTANVGNPNIAPAAGVIAATGNPPSGRTSSRRPAASGRRRPTAR